MLKPFVPEVYKHVRVMGYGGCWSNENAVAPRRKRLVCLSGVVACSNNNDGFAMENGMFAPPVTTVPYNTYTFVDIGSSSSLIARTGVDRPSCAASLRAPVSVSFQRSRIVFVVKGTLGLAEIMPSSPYAKLAQVYREAYNRVDGQWGGSLSRTQA